MLQSAITLLLDDADVEFVSWCGSANSTSASSNNNAIADCNIILTILQSLVGVNQPSTTQSRKTLGNDLVFVKSSIFESNNYISLRNFHEQQNFYLKTTINYANERD